MSSAIGKRSALVRVGSFSNSPIKSDKRNAANGNGGAVVREAGPTGDGRVFPDDLPCSVQPARPGEHVIARQMLAGVLCGPSPAEYQAQQDDPSQAPADRWFCKVGNVYAGHVRMVKRELVFGTSVLPITLLSDLLVLPEYRRQGIGSALLKAVEHEMIRDQKVLGMLRTNQPQFFLQRGWCVWSRHSYSLAGAREILSELIERRSVADSVDKSERANTSYNIRLWRHIEQGALIQLYEQGTRGKFGAMVRSEEYWQWLLARHAFDRIYVAIDGPERFELNEIPSIVGYAVMKQGRLLEVMVSPDHPEAGYQLLARACSDAIEQDAHYVRLDAPVGDPLHNVVARAGGELGYHELLQGEVCLVKALDLHRLVELLGDQFCDRARGAGISLPVEIGIQLKGVRHILELRGRSAKLKSGRSCRSFFECSSNDLTQLMLGHLDLGVALASHRVSASTRIATELVTAIFPKLPLWRPPWDELPAN